MRKIATKKSETQKYQAEIVRLCSDYPGNTTLAGVAIVNSPKMAEGLTILANHWPAGHERHLAEWAMGNQDFTWQHTCYAQHL